MAKLSLMDTNVDENWIESKRNEVLKVLDKLSNYFTKFIKDKILRVTSLLSVKRKLENII